METLLSSFSEGGKSNIDVHTEKVVEILMNSATCS